MRIGLIDADLLDNGTRHPNLAIMKLAGYYKEQGHDVELIYDSYESVKKYDKVLISKVFTFTKVPEWVLLQAHVEYGGTGFFEDGGENLPNEIEHHMPDYDIYAAYVKDQLDKGYQRARFSDYLDYSIGFTSRGCFRKCGFCVNKKYDRAFLHSPVTEFLDPERPYIYLWDDNILALPEWETVLDDIEATGRPFQFRQGIDIRLMTDRKAKRLVNTHYHGDFIFAFDHLGDRDVITAKIQLWKRYSSKVCKLYVLCAYESQDERDIANTFERISILMQYGSIPYIMRYEDYKKSRFKSLYIELARWCNQPNFFKKKSFREFCVANQEYKKNQETNCSAYQAMLDFEENFPDIAERYFDLRFDERNLYSMQYGYGRKYANKPLCQNCQRRGVCWSAFADGTVPVKLVLQAYFTKELDLECLRYANAACQVDIGRTVSLLIDAIERATVKEILEFIGSSDEREEVTQENIPQFSTIELAFYNVTDILRDYGKEVTFEEMGGYLSHNQPGFKHTEVAHIKYGENHTKLAALLDLVRIVKTNGRYVIELSEFGKVYSRLPRERQKRIIYKLHFRIPFIQNYFLSGCREEIIDRDLMILAKTTQKRRGNYAKSMARSIQEALNSGVI